MTNVNIIHYWYLSKRCQLIILTLISNASERNLEKIQFCQYVAV